jgi:hypothetical protein
MRPQSVARVGCVLATLLGLALSRPLAAQGVPAGFQVENA